MSKPILSGTVAAEITLQAQDAIAGLQTILKSLKVTYFLTADEWANVESMLAQSSELFWQVDEIETFGDPDAD